VNIRPETPRDYAAIAALNVRAFDQRAGEALVVDLLRHRAAFDPNLSLVAEIDERIVGHVLFSPYTIKLLGQDVRAVNLAPIAVDPAHQKQGIGGALIEAGHQSAREKGFVLSFLLGHVEYYPRFGYRTGVYGVSSLILEAIDVSQSEKLLETRKPLEADVPVLRELWLHEEGNVDFALDPGDALLDWLSPNPAITAAVYVRDGQIVGYTRVSQHEPDSPRVFLAADAEAARSMAAMLMVGGASLTLPLHPLSTSSAALGAAQISAWDAGMAFSLKPNPFDEFVKQLERSERPAGRPIWPVVFDLAE